MTINYSKDCGNSPKNKLIEEMFVSVITHDLSKLESYFDKSIEVVCPNGKSKKINLDNLDNLEFFNYKTKRIPTLDILNIASHGKSAAINGRLQW